MTKREVRLVALERLELTQASLFIDVGAGTGSVAIEAAYRYPHLRVAALERNPDALALIRQNCQRFDLTRVEIIAGEAPLPMTERADALFIGGSGGNLAEIIHWAGSLLLPGGRLVINLILLENLNQALQCLALGGFSEVDCIQMQIATLTGLGSGHYFKPNNPAFIISCRKENTNDSAL